MNLHINSITKETSVETGDRFLSVNFEIRNGEEVALTRNLAFPMNVERKTIEEELKRHLEVYETEVARQEVQRDIDNEDKNADNIISKLENQDL